MTMRGPLCSTFLSIAASLVLAGCDPDATASTQLLLKLETDLSAESALGYVEVQVLDVGGSNIHDSHWFSVDSACFANPDSVVILGSMGLAKATRDQARLRVIGYGRKEDGSASEAITARVDAKFKANTSLTVPILLASACYEREDPCASNETCDPSSGACELVALATELRASTDRDKRTGDCLTELKDPPFTTAAGPVMNADAGTPVEPDTGTDDLDTAMDDADTGSELSEAGGESSEAGSDMVEAGPTPVVCVSDDNECATGCTPFIDTDCRKTKGEPCAQASDCKPSLFCAQGYCCDKPCTGACEQCNGPDNLGTCSPIDFQKRDDAANCRACGRVCSGTHVEPMCNAGECVGACEPSFSDCNNNKQADGCETDLRTVDNCGTCGRACSRANASTTACTDNKCAPICLDGFSDCNANSAANDGCEQNIQDDPAHCGGCGDAYRCAYPFCHAKKCARVRGDTLALGFERVPAGVVVGSLVTLAPSTVVGFGALLRNVSQPPARVRFALYESSNAGTPMSLRVESSAVPVVDFVASTNSDDPLLFTLAAASHVNVFAGDYWIVVTAEKPIDVMIDEDFISSRWQGVSADFGRFAPTAPVGMLAPGGLSVLDLVVFVIDAS
jgi:hypothetical protein